MAEVDERIIMAQNGIVETDAEYDDLFKRVRTDEEVREMALELVHALETRIEVHKAILAGRYGRDCAWEWDDIEVVIVSPDFEGMHSFDRTELTSELAERGNVRPIVAVHGEFTPEEYLSEDPQHMPMLGWDYYSGKVIYEKDGG